LLSVKEVDAKLSRLKTRSSARDQRMRDVLSVRQGDISKVFPSMFSEDYPKPLVANFIDVAARDLAEAMAPLPSFNCSATNMVSDAQRKAADTRTRIANYYVGSSDLQLQMYTGADWYNTYGLLPAIIEMDYETNNPRIRLLNPFGVYPEVDRFGRCISMTQVVVTDAETLASQYPEFYDQIINRRAYQTSSPYISMVRYHDKDQDLIYLPERENLVISRVKNQIGKCLARVVTRSSLDGEARGQFDDVLAVQLARARFAVLQIQAAEKSIQAPIAIPQDVQELALGPDAIMRTANPQSIRRVGLDLPPGIFTESGVLDVTVNPQVAFSYPNDMSSYVGGYVQIQSAVYGDLGTYFIQSVALDNPAYAYISPTNTQLFSDVPFNFAIDNYDLPNFNYMEAVPSSTEYYLDLFSSEDATRSKPASVIMLRSRYHQLTAGVKSAGKMGVLGLSIGREFADPSLLHLCPLSHNAQTLSAVSVVTLA